MIEKAFECCEANDGKHPNCCECPYLKLLKRCGYVMAEEEKKYYEGTHEIFVKDGEDNE